MFTSRQALTTTQIIFLFVAVVLSLIEIFFPSLPALPAALLSFLIGFSAAMISLQLQIDRLEAQHSKLMKRISQVDKIKRYERVFLDHQHTESNKEHPHIRAFLRTGRTQGIDHVVRMAESVRSMKAQIPIDIEDPRLTEEFLRNLMVAVQDLGPGCVWLGTSLVYRPEGWTGREIQTFATAIREKSSRKKLKVYRAYIFDQKIGGMAEYERKLFDEHISVEVDNNISVRIARHGSNMGDVSLLCLPPKGGVHNNAGEEHDDRPGHRKTPPWVSWEQLRDDGWRVVFALRWEIQNGCDISRIEVYSGEHQFVEREYKRFVELWAKSTPLHDADDGKPAEARERP